MEFPAGMLEFMAATDAYNHGTCGREVKKSSYQQHRRGAIVWVHNKVQAHHTPPQHQAAWENWVDEVYAGTAGMKDAAVVGAVDHDVQEWMAAHKKGSPATADIVATRSRVQHTLNDLKQSRGAGVGIAAVKGLPAHLANPKAVLWDEEDPALIYVFDAGGGHPGQVRGSGQLRRAGDGDAELAPVRRTRRHHGPGDGPLLEGKGEPMIWWDAYPDRPPAPPHRIATRK